MHEDKKSWEIHWKKTGETISEKDIYHLIDEIKLEYLLQILPSSGKNIKTIEVGCGSARLSCFLASMGYSTTCLDYSESALEVAKENYQITGNKGEFILGSAEDIPFVDESFDIVLSTGLLEHFENPQIVIDEMVRILKPGGIFYSDIVPKKFSSIRGHIVLIKKIKYLNKEEKDAVYEKELNSEDIRNMLHLAKLVDINVFPAGVFLPIIPYKNSLVNIEKLQCNFSYKVKPLIKRLDGTFIAEKLGFYYFASAKKPIK